MIRDMISNIAKQTEMMHYVNALLITTKPPSPELLSYAAQAGVTVRSLDDVSRTKRAWAAASDKEALLVRDFGLVPDGDAAAKRRKLAMEEWIRNPSRDLAKRTAFGAAYKVRFYLLGLLIGLAIAVTVAAALSPGFREAAKSIGLLIIVAPFAWLYWKHINKPERKQRRKTRRSR